jgi:hypothetical protein
MQRTWHPNKLQKLLNKGYSLNEVSTEFAPIVEGVGTKKGGYKSTRKSRSSRRSNKKATRKYKSRR